MTSPAVIRAKDGLQFHVLMLYNARMCKAPLPVAPIHSGAPDIAPGRRRHYFRRIVSAGVAAGALLGLGWTGASAQTIGSGERPFSLNEKRNEFGVWVGSSLGLPSALADSRDTKFPALIGLRYGRVLAANRLVAIEYTLDLIPVAVVSQPQAPQAGGTSAAGKHQSVYGAGIAPVGFKFIAKPHGRVMPFVGVSSAAMYFQTQVPVAGSARFNFLSVADLGVTIPTSSRRAITIGYRLGHLSNAGISRVNPGFNSSTVYAGFSVFR